METRTQKDARGRENCESGRSEEGPFNKCLSCLIEIDGSLSDISYTGFNTGGTRAAGVDVPEAAGANPTCKHIDGDFCCKYNPARVRGDADAAVNIFALICEGTQKLQGSSEEAVNCVNNASKFTNLNVSENQYSKWPVKLVDNTYVCDNSSILSSPVQNCDEFIQIGTPAAVSKWFKHRQEGNTCFASDSRNFHVITPDRYTRCKRREEDFYVVECKKRFKYFRDEENQPLSYESVDIVRRKDGLYPTPLRSTNIDSSFPNSSLIIDRDQSGWIPSSQLCHGAFQYFNLLDTPRTSNLRKFYINFLPGTNCSMKPAKIGQLTPISYRSPPIDRSNRRGAGVQVIPTAQPAWLCGRDGCVVVGDVDGDGDHGDEVDGPVIATKCNLNVACCSSNLQSTNIATPKITPVAIHGTPTLTNSRRETKLSKSDSIRDNNQRTDDTRFSKFRFEFNDVDEQTIDNNCMTKDEFKTSGASSNNNEYPFVVALGIHQKVDDLIELQAADSVCAGTCIYESQSPFNASLVVDILSGDCSTDISQRLENTDKCETSIKERFCFKRNVHDEKFDGEKTRTEIAAGNQSNTLTDMNIKEATQSVVYANFLTDRNSVSSTDQPDKLVCLSNVNKNEQILAVNPMNFHQNRLSHQYLNSSVTGQDYPDFLPEVGQNYPYFFTDTGIVTCPDFELHSNMIFTATTTGETSFIEKSNICQSNPLSSSVHHYYNKSNILTPCLRETSASPNNGSRQCEDNIFSDVFPIKSKHDRREHDLDMMFFPQLSQLHCPMHRSSPLSSPHLQHHHQQQSLYQHYEQQQLLSQFYPNCRENRQQQQTQQRQRGRNSVTSAISLMHHIKCGPHHISISPVSLLWTFLSVLVAGTCLLSFLTPYWTVHPDHVHSFGLFNLCVRDPRFSHPRPLCLNFGHQNYYSGTRFSVATGSSNITTEDIEIDTSSVDVAKIPSGAWQAACLLFGAGVCVQILGALTSLVVLTLNEPWHHRTALLNGYMQTVGVLLLVSGILLYPVGFSSPFYSYYCDSSKAFCTGHCSMGWSYVTAVMSTALSIFCPVMSSFAEAQQVPRKHVTIIGPTAT